MQPTDYRSDELMRRLCDKIDLDDRIIFLPHLIEIPYRINSRQKAIIRSTPLEIAEFAQQQCLIHRYEKHGKNIKMYDIQILPKTDRRGYPFQIIDELEVKKIPTLFSREEIKWMVARYEYDFGDINDIWNDLFAPKGIVRALYPDSINPTKQTA